MPVERLSNEPTGNSTTGDFSSPTTPSNEGGLSVPSESGISPGKAGQKGFLSFKRGGKAQKKYDADDPFRFSGDGVDFKAKLIGIRDVPDARGDEMCQEAMQIAKALVKQSGQHKQRITVNVSLEGLKIKDEKTGTILYTFPVQKISFIARDMSDARAFSFIYGCPENKHKFYGIKTEKAANDIVLSIRDMFHIVYEMKKRQIEEAKKSGKDASQSPAEHDTKALNGQQNGAGGVPEANLLDLESELRELETGMNQLDTDWDGFISNRGTGTTLSSAGDSGTPSTHYSGAHSQFEESYSSVNSYQSDAFVTGGSSFSSSGMAAGSAPYAPSSRSGGDPFGDSWSSIGSGATHASNGSTKHDAFGVPNLPPPQSGGRQRRETPTSGSADLFGITGGTAQVPAMSVGSTPGHPQPHPNTLQLSNPFTPDPFDTTHVSGMLKQTSTPNQPVNAPVALFGDVSHIPHSGSTSTTEMSTSNSVFDNHQSSTGFNRAAFLSDSSASMWDSPLQPENLARRDEPPALALNNGAMNGGKGGVDDIFGSLCNIDNLKRGSGGVAAGFSAASPVSSAPGAVPTNTFLAKKSDPFHAVKNPPKKSMNELRGDSPTTFTPIPATAYPHSAPAVSNPFMPMAPSANAAGAPLAPNSMGNLDFLAGGFGGPVPAIPPRGAAATTNAGAFPALPRPQAGGPRRSQQDLCQLAVPPPQGMPKPAAATAVGGGRFDPFADDFFK